MKSRWRAFGDATNGWEWTESTHVNEAPPHPKDTYRAQAYVVGLAAGVDGLTDKWFTVTAQSFEKAIDIFVESDYGKPLWLDTADLATGDWGTAEKPADSYHVTGGGKEWDNDHILYGPEGAVVEITQQYWVCPRCGGIEFHVSYDERRSARLVQPAVLEVGETTYFPDPDYNNSTICEVDYESFNVSCDGCSFECWVSDDLKLLKREERFPE